MERPKSYLHNHHIIHHGRQWESGEDTKFIRRRSGLIVPMEDDLHRELHRNVPGVPLLDIFMARRVRSIMARERMSNPIDAVDTFCFVVEEAMEHVRTFDTERSVGKAAIEAVRMQLPYIREAV